MLCTHILVVHGRTVAIYASTMGHVKLQADDACEHACEHISRGSAMPPDTDIKLNRWQCAWYVCSIARWPHQVLLDVSTSSAGAQNGAALQLNALHGFAVQHHRLRFPVVEALVPIPGSRSTTLDKPTQHVCHRQLQNARCAAVSWQQANSLLCHKMPRWAHQRLMASFPV